MIVTAPAVIRTHAAADYTGKSCRLERDFRTRPLDAGPYTVAAADALTTKVREGGRVNVHTSVTTGVNARARTGSLVPIGAEPFRQGCEHGHGRFWPLLKYRV